MDQHATWPRRHCVRWGPSSAPKAAQPPSFRPMSIVAKLLPISATAEHLFQDGSHPPSWICDARVWTTREGHLVVFIAVQNLVGIDAVLVFCKLGLKTAIHAPKVGFLRNLTQVSRKPPKGSSLGEQTSYATCARDNEAKKRN